MALGALEAKRTQKGVLLLLASFLLAPLPYLSVAGGVLGIIGGIYFVRGMKNSVSRIADSSAALTVYVLGTLISIPVAIAFPLVSTEMDLLSGFNVDIALYLFAGLVSSALTGASILLFTYKLQDSQGKMLLWIGYGAALATGVLTLLLGEFLLASVLQQACALGCYPPSTSSLLALQSNIQLLRVLGFIPATIYFTAYYRVRSKIKKQPLLQEKMNATPTSSILS